MTTTVDLHEAETHLSQLLERVAAGEEFLIAREGQPVAELRAVRRADLRLGTMAGEIEFADAFSEQTEREVAAMLDADPAGGER